jgi:NADH-quinone oxidoreductase subunit A
VGAPLWPLAFYFVAVVVLLATIIGLSALLGESHRERTTAEPYESGMMLTGSARRRFDVNFYLMAVFFVIFDLETAFIIGWAIALRQVGWSGYVEVVVFIAILLAALVYLWRVGALEVRGKGPDREPNRMRHPRE